MEDRAELDTGQGSFMGTQLITKLVMLCDFM